MNVPMHATAIVDEGAHIGDGARVWHWVDGSPQAQIGARCSLGQNFCVGNDVVIGNDVKIQENVSDTIDLPAVSKVRKSTYRNIEFSGEQLEFSEGFPDLQTISNRQILAGKGYGLGGARHFMHSDRKSQRFNR